jgi:uncharacterized sulfatase
MTQTRRAFLATTAASAAAAQSASRPNIFFAIADDHSFAHTSWMGDPAVRTPHIDRVGKQGIAFTHSWCASPSCTPSRAAVLTGQHIWRLKESANLWSTLRKSDYPVYPDLLEKAGYEVGLLRKGWGPGDFKPGGFDRNPAGPSYRSFDEFMAKLPGGKPFCFWFGTSDPHRPYEPGSGKANGIDPAKVNVPPFLPDNEHVRNDIADYMFEVQRWDRELGEALALMEKKGVLNNTLVVITSDNGMPFPRAKGNLYDYGSRMPLVVQWPARIKPGQTSDAFVNHIDFAPTFLEACGVPIPAAVTGRSLMPIFDGKRDPVRDHVIFGRERHTVRRPGRVGYPMRAIRTRDWLYIRNYEPSRWPAGDPEDYGDIDGGPTKTVMMEQKPDRLFDLAFGKRPAEELYDLRKDPGQMNNIAADPAAARAKSDLSRRLKQTLVKTADPRETGAEVLFDKYDYNGRT